MNSKQNLSRLARLWAAAIPETKIASVVEWGKRYVKLIGSALSEAYNPDITPWTKEPLERTDDGTRSSALVKPVQGGGSVMGEVALCRQVACSNGGDIQYNWQNDIAADARWATRVEKILLACEPVMARTSKARFKWTIGQVIFPHCNFIMQGINTNRAVASISIRWQMNEEVHDEDGGWAPGKLQQAQNRLTAYWNSFCGIISNAGYEGDQLHKAFLAGTQQEWEVPCPGCGKFHVMRTRWDRTEPHLGGLRYDAEGCRRGNGDYDYTRLAGTIRMQMPCGALLGDDEQERHKLSLGGRYSAGRAGGDPAHRSYTLEGVSIDYIPWLSLIKQKHEALKALKYGDAEPYSVYIRERECRFYKKGLQPIAQNIVLSAARKDRAGLPGRLVRLGAGDYQKGKAEAGEMPHWWHVIADVAIDETTGKIHLLIVSEGKITTDIDLADTFKRHEVLPSCVVLDSSWNAEHVYQLCLRHGFYAVKGENAGLYAGHKDGSRKIYSPPRPLHAMNNQPPVYPYKMYRGEQVPDAQEPMFIRYSLFGLLDRVNWLRTSPMVYFEVPGDVSEDFKSHLDAWQSEKLPNKKTLQMENVWRQRRDRDDLLQCVGYIGIFMQDMGVIGATGSEELGPDDGKNGGEGKNEEGGR